MRASVKNVETARTPTPRATQTVRHQRAPKCEVSRRAGAEPSARCGSWAMRWRRFEAATAAGAEEAVRDAARRVVPHRAKTTSAAAPQTASGAKTGSM